MSPVRIRIPTGFPSAPVCTVIFLVICFAVPPVCFAGQLIQSDVSYAEGVYLIDVTMDIGGDIDKAREILLDYGQTPRYNQNIIKAELLDITDSGMKIGRVEIRDCLLLLCRNLVQIQEMEKLSSGNIRIHVIPDKSDYRTADYLWRFIPQANGMTRLLINAVIAPKVRVPPLIGPIMVARKLKLRMVDVVNRLERLSQPDQTQ